MGSRAALTSIAVISVLFCCVMGDIGREPKRCCSPSQWEADLYRLYIGTPEEMADWEATGKFIYDFKNKRWAYNQEHAQHPKNNTRMIFDHQQGVKAAIVGDTCLRAPLKVRMKRYCIPQNATYVGTYHYGPEPGQVEFHAWAYDVGGFLVRHMMKVTVDKCMPVQDAAFGVVVNQWRWYTGEKPCIPWQYPDRVRSGDCYKSHFKRETTKAGAVATKHFANFQFGNIQSKVKSPHLFEIPSDCEEVEDFGQRVTLPAPARMWTMWLKY